MAEINRMGQGHHVILENQKKLHLTGVKDVAHFDDHTVLVVLGTGSLSVRGEGLRVGKLDVDHGDLMIEGLVTALIYAEGAGGKKGGWGKLLR